ncbi:2-oxo-4-hydroxy-4-carboxy-5-ureidoimidazoline decarboxylase [Micromonospora rhizosphaerae]|uniref:2-oxo-4-hydroxy-4-carboxy-5-ureidoimidazoline decarboxylase n=1 Tax=Micromonospora rhizosphaerae TaxID=568872 RepID=A0A1C6SXW7_9ACTN|nr:2-oxo-4-hydroxy-4-carboxy-5-ureidoimidazoline decarboxylase [Micromonospora rhizosphaerae]SCL34367.1 2-oxo-4-hydroxy-4-carboxy-5-ureidoimidazoline decarboxylase [Micromonospora rhizosphaerae]
MIGITPGGGALAGFNRAPAGQAERDLLACCAVPEWAREVAAGRPYPSLRALVESADGGLLRLSWEQVAQALAAHPRIGERVAGTDRESAWSRREQAGMDGADAATRAALVEANRAYERRFGHIFLIFASGRTDAELLAAARDRLTNDAATERRVVHGELRRIALQRLERLVG